MKRQLLRVRVKRNRGQTRDAARAGGELLPTLTSRAPAPLLHSLQGFYSVHCIPIIENTARECELTDRLREAIAAYPQARLREGVALIRVAGVVVRQQRHVHAAFRAAICRQRRRLQLRYRLSHCCRPAVLPVPLSLALPGRGHSPMSSHQPEA